MVSFPLSHAHSTSKQGSRYGPLVCPSEPSLGGLQRICSWHPSMRHSRGEDLVNTTIKLNAEKEEFPLSKAVSQASL